MDICLKRLRQELLSMKEAGDGLHAQMNCMMGALQELKLLQVQTTLEQLKISGKSSCDSAPQANPANSISEPLDQAFGMSSQEHQTYSQHTHHSSIGSTPCTSSLESKSAPDGRMISGSTTPPGEYCSPSVCQPPVEYNPEQKHLSQPGSLDLSTILYSLSQEGPSMDSDYTEDSLDDSNDWTSTLLSCSRNRQPLVLGNNVLADLVGNWLELPELDKDCPEGGKGLSRPDSPDQPLHLTQLQEQCKRFSLTSKIFKRFLRSVRPDRDKLLKEKPGWMPPGHKPEAELLKRPKKTAKAKTSFYRPFWSGGQQAKGRLSSQKTDAKSQFLGLYIDMIPKEPENKVQPLLDHSKAVWV